MDPVLDGDGERGHQQAHAQAVEDDEGGGLPRFGVDAERGQPDEPGDGHEGADAYQAAVAAGGGDVAAATIEAAVRPSIIGASSRPETVALAPPTTWRKTGRKMLVDIMTAPLTKARAMPAAKMSLRKRRRGRMGLVVRSSWSTNRIDPTAPATRRPTMVGEVQARSSPPIEAAIRSAPTRRSRARLQASRCRRPVGARQAEVATDEGQGDEADGDVEVEDPAPAEHPGVDDQAAEEGTDQAREGEGAGEEAHVAAPLPRGEDVAQDDEGEGLEAAAPMPCRARKATSWVIDCDSPARTEAARNNTMDAMKVGRRPWNR